MGDGHRRRHSRAEAVLQTALAVANPSSPLVDVWPGVVACGRPPSERRRVVAGCDKPLTAPRSLALVRTP